MKSMPCARGLGSADAGDPYPDDTNVGKRQKTGLWFANFSVAVVAALLPCLAAELILRLLSPPADTPGLYIRVSSESEWSGRAHARGLQAGTPVAFNRFGLRDRERSMEPAPGTVRILFLGDSVTFGLGVAEEDSYPRVIEALLNGSRTDGRASVEVLNSAIPGYNTIQELAQLRELGLAFQPRIVVVGYLYNDIEPSEGERNRPVARIQAGDAHEAPSAAPLARRIKSDINAGVVYLKQHSLFFSWLTPRLGTLLRPLGAGGFGQAGEIKDQYVDSNPRWRRVQRALLEMKRLCDERKIRLVIAIIPAMARFSESGYPIKEYHEAVSALCHAHSISCLDLLPAFWGLDGTQFWISPTDGHPNARAHRIMAEALARFLASLLPRGAEKQA
jgi:lysophospholipase L1-like esterase